MSPRYRTWKLVESWSCFGPTLPCCLPVPSFGMGTFLLYNIVFLKHLTFTVLLNRGSYLRIDWSLLEDFRLLNTVVTIRL